MRLLYKVLGLYIVISSIAIIGVSCGSEEVYVDMNSRVSEEEAFEYVTSITSPTNSSYKAEIYSYKGSVNEALKAIEAIEVPTDKDVLISNRAIILNYYMEEIFIYEGEGKETYIQVSPEIYTQNTSYSNNYRGGSFLRTYGAFRLADDVSIKYGKLRREKKKVDITSTSGGSKSSSGSSSIRSSSSGSRSSSGGGTSFGK